MQEYIKSIISYPLYLLYYLLSVSLAPYLLPISAYVHIHKICKMCVYLYVYWKQFTKSTDCYFFMPPEKRK